MRIQKTRILSLNNNLPGIAEGTELVFTVPLSEVSPLKLQRIGFSPKLGTGEKVLPSILGRISSRNAEGSIIKHKNKPMETCYRQREWRYKQWHGRDRREVTEIVNVPYKRYQRTFIPPPAVELIIVELPDGRKAVATDKAVRLDLQNPKEVLHCINLMLELFGLCDVLDKNLVPTGTIPTISLNWQVLPPGEMPWSTLEPHLKRVLNAQKNGARPVVEHRLKEINRYKPTFSAVGHGGFAGYVVFGFPDRDLYVFECARYGNATYVFEGNWKELSKLSKAEILSQERQKARFIHQANWEGLIRSLFRTPKAT
jgi:hypothetical protein